MTSNTLATLSLILALTASTTVLASDQNKAMTMIPDDLAFVSPALKTQQTIPTRAEMHNIIRTAHERGVTFYDAAEAYGPHEVERILGEGFEPFRDQIVIATKNGWNIDLETGERNPGLNSRPEHIKLAVEGMLKRLRADRRRCRGHSGP